MPRNKRHHACAVATCQSGTTKFYKTCNEKDQKIAFHSFPKDKKVAKIWFSLCKRQDRKSVYPTRNDKMCSLHFDESSYERDLMNELLNLPLRKVLKEDSIPCNALPNMKNNIEIDLQSRRSLTRKMTPNPGISSIDCDIKKLNEKNLKKKKQVAYEQILEPSEKRLAHDCSDDSIKIDEPIEVVKVELDDSCDLLSSRSHSLDSLALYSQPCDEHKYISQVKESPPNLQNIEIPQSDSQSLNLSVTNTQVIEPEITNSQSKDPPSLNTSNIHSFTLPSGHLQLLQLLPINLNPTDTPRKLQLIKPKPTNSSESLHTSPSLQEPIMPRNYFKANNNRASRSSILSARDKRFQQIQKNRNCQDVKVLTKDLRFLKSELCTYKNKARNQSVKIVKLESKVKTQTDSYQKYKMLRKNLSIFFTESELKRLESRNAPYGTKTLAMLNDATFTVNL